MGRQTMAIVLPEPGVSGICKPALPGPEQRSRRLPSLISRFQHGYRITRRVNVDGIPEPS